MRLSRFWVLGGLRAIRTLLPSVWAAAAVPASVLTAARRLKYSWILERCRYRSRQSDLEFTCHASCPPRDRRGYWARSGSSLSCRYRSPIRRSRTYFRGIRGPRRNCAGGRLAVLFLENSLEIPAGWQLLRDGTLVQIVCPTGPDRPSLAESILPMTSRISPR
jgi:hypothetical protein